MYKIAVIGTGYVGLTTAIGLANFGSIVQGVDVDDNKIRKLSKGEMPIYEPGMKDLLQNNMNAGRLHFSTDIEKGIEWADIIFIAVGTPQGQDGHANLTTLYNVAETIGKSINGYTIVVTKSTVPIGTNERIKEIISQCNSKHYEFDVVSNPEFLREGKAIYDFLHPDRIVIGTDNQRPIEAMKKIYRSLYLNEVPFVFTDFRTAELIKYSSNCFLAMKVGFINEMSRICDAVEADVQMLSYAIGKDGRIGNKFLHAGPGYGGSCFPKDTHALAAFTQNLDISLPLIHAIIDSNEKQKLHVARKIKKYLSNEKVPNKVAILGLAFKSETDDMRDAAAITIINELLKENVVISVFDPKAIENAKLIWNDKIAYAKNEYEAINNADIIVILTEWNQFRNLDLQRIKENMRGNVFLDLRNIYKSEEVIEYGFVYEGIGTRR